MSKITQCPFCHNTISEQYECPVCQSVLVYEMGGPFGTYECPVCSNEKWKVGYRLTIGGLVRAKFKVGRYQIPPTEKEKDN